MRTGHYRIAVVAANALLYFCTFSSSAHAHPPYQTSEGYHVGSDGRRYEFGKSFIDGIVLTDPVKLVIKDDSGKVIDETAYARNICLLKWGMGTAIVFEYHSPISFLPEKVWTIYNGKLISQPSPWYRLLGIVYPLIDQFIWYSVSLLFLLVPIAILFWIRKKNRKLKNAILMITFGTLSVIYYSGHDNLHLNRS